MNSIDNLDFKLVKAYTFPDKEAEKYNILAFFKEQSRREQAALNALTGDGTELEALRSLGGKKPQALRGLYGSADGSTSAPQGPLPAVGHTTVTYKCFPDLTFTDWMLIVIAVLLFLILITR